MIQLWLYSLVSVIAVSLVSLIGILSFAVNQKNLKNMLILFVSFSAGALFGDAFIHLLPEAVSEHGFSIGVSLSVLAGIIISFIVEKVIHWNHCHLPITATHVHSFSIMNLVGDFVHNFIDGLIIGASYTASIPVGIYTTFAILLHEIPQEIGDFGVLLHGGFSRAKALLLNFFVSLTAVVGVIVSLLASSFVENLTSLLIPFAAGTFIYIAGSDLIPELHKECETKKSWMQVLMFILGVVVMMALLLVG